MLDNNLSLGNQCPLSFTLDQFQSFLCWIIIYHPKMPNSCRECPFQFQSFLCWIIIYHQNIILVHHREIAVSILLMLDNNLSLLFFLFNYIITCYVSILLMLDNNLSHGKLANIGDDISRFQSFLCWIIIYHHMPFPVYILHYLHIVSILLMLDNNLSPK